MHLPLSLWIQRTFRRISRQQFLFLGALLLLLLVTLEALSAYLPRFPQRLLKTSASTAPSIPPVNSLTTFRLADNPIPVAVVSAASYQASVAPESIAAAFGTQLAVGTFTATDTDPNLPGIQLPTSLGGTFIEINGQRAELFFVSPQQINLVIPAGTTSGQKNVRVTSGDGTISNGTAQLNQVAPAIFTANATEGGVPAGYLVRTSGQITTNEPIEQNNPQFPVPGDPNVLAKIPKPILPGEAIDIITLVLFGTGLRRAADPNNDGNRRESFEVFIGATSAQIDFIGPQGGFIGLDQINVQIPRSLAGRGPVRLNLTSPGTSNANEVSLEIAAPPGVQVNSFGADNVLAGEVVTINGSGFSSDPAKNLVRVGEAETRDILTASPTQLQVRVPPGAESKQVTVISSDKEGRSNQPLSVRTSLSGYILDNLTSLPMEKVEVVFTSSGKKTTTRDKGWFLLPDPEINANVAIGEIKITGFQVEQKPEPPYPVTLLKLFISEKRDNPFTAPIRLTQSTGTPLCVIPAICNPPPSAASLLNRAENALRNLFSVRAFAPHYTASEENAQQAGYATLLGNILLELPPNLNVQFPEGVNNGLIFLTQIHRSRAPAELPAGLFSQTVVQIAPFGVRFTPGATLSFPNADNLPAGAQARLFRLDQTPGSPTLGEFIDVGSASVSVDGQRVTTAPGAITETSIYFAGIRGDTTTVIGRVLDSDRTPVRLAIVDARGQSDFTDGNGGYVLRNVAIPPGNTLLSVEASFVRPDGRVDQAQRNNVPMIASGITRVPDIILPARTSNQPPTLLGPLDIIINVNQTQDFNILAHDPDSGQPVSLSLNAPEFVSLIQSPGPALRLVPRINDVGSFSITLTATDNQGLSTLRQINVTVINATPRITLSGNGIITRRQGDAATPLPLAAVSDPDATAGSLAVSATNVPAGITVSSLVNSGGTVSASITAGCNAIIGNNLVTLNVSDGRLAAAATLTVNVIAAVAPAITQQPASQTICAGNNASFSVAANGTNFSYQWRRNGLTLSNGSQVSGATTPTLAISNAGTNDNALYDVVITGVCSATTSNAARLTVNTAPGITIQPISQTVTNGSTVTFTAAATAVPAASVKWQVQFGARGSFTDLPGATSPTLTFTATLADHLNKYRAVFSNACGLATTNEAMLTVNLVCAPLPAGLIGWYRGEGDATDRVIGNNGTLRPLETGPTFTTGKVGQAFSFDGTDDFIQIPDHESFTVSSLSLAAWINPSALTGTNSQAIPIVSKYDTLDPRSQGVSWGLFLNNGKLSLSVAQDASVFRAAETVNAVISVGTFQHVAATFDQSTQTIRIYVNGVEAATTPDPKSSTITSIADTTTPVRIGSAIFSGSFSGPAFYKGLIDEVDIAGRALTAAEVRAIYNADRLGKCLPAGCQSPSFTAKTFSVSVTSLAAISIADFNNDKIPDLATAYLSQNSAQTLRGLGNGDFATPSPLSTSGNSSAIATGDFNKDGNPDLVTANLFTSNVSVLLGNGSGGFGRASNIGAGSSPESVSVGDFNGDGNPDIVTANRNSNNLSVLSGNGKGGFGTATSFVVGTSPTSVTVGDFNGDGRPDLASANSGSNNISVLLNQGSGNFSPAVNYAAGQLSTDLQTGDFNGDGKPDLVTTDDAGDAVVVLLNQGNGTFGTANKFNAGFVPFRLAVADFNGDGRLDLAATDDDSDRFSLLLGNDSGVFGPPRFFSDGRGAIATGDFNGDGKPDLVIRKVNPDGPDGITVLLNACGLILADPPANAQVERQK